MTSSFLLNSIQHQHQHQKQLGRKKKDERPKINRVIQSGKEANFPTLEFGGQSERERERETERV